MFLNLKAEMIRKNVTSGDLAELLKVTQSTMSLKINGKAKFTLDEAIAIKKALGVDMEIEELFADSIA